MENEDTIYIKNDSTRELPIRPFSGAEICDPSLYDMEESSFLRNQLWYIGHSSELTQPGQFVTSEYFGEPVALIR